MSRNKHVPVRLPKDPFAYIGLWQFIAFMLLLLLIWFNELKDMAAFFFKVDPGEPNIIRGCVLSAFVMVTAVIAIGNTYLQEKRVLNGLVSVCANCHKVRINEERWKQLEEFVSDNSLLTFTHGYCPTCLGEIMKTVDELDKSKHAKGAPQPSVS